MQKTLESAPVLYLAMDLGSTRWQLAFTLGAAGRPRYRVVAARDLGALIAEIGEAKRRLGLPSSARVVSVYEAGRDGFWLHRWLVRNGIENVIVDPASIEVDQRAKRAKTDRIDSARMLRCLVRHARGEPSVWRVVRVPDVVDEDVRRLQRERKRLVKRRTALNNEAHAMLATVGIKLAKLTDLGERLSSLRDPNGATLPTNLRRALKRIVESLELVDDQLREIEIDRKTLLEQDEQRATKIELLTSLSAIGPEAAWTLVLEVFGWRQIKNRKQLGALAGLCATPHNSDSSTEERGISKAGNPRLRALMVEIAWLWLRYQPESKLTKWFEERFAAAGRHARKRGIVAVARKLLVELWHFVEHGVVPHGVRFKEPKQRLAAAT